MNSLAAPLVIKRRQLIKPQQAAELAQQILELPAAYWLSRSDYFVNPGIKGKPGHYHCVGMRSCPKALRQQLVDIAPQYEDMQLEEFVINRYQKGDHIPAHQDKQGYFRIDVLLLQGRDGLTVYQDETLKRCVYVTDSQGQLVTLSSIQTIHEVLPVSNTRVSVVFLYR